MFVNPTAGAKLPGDEFAALEQAAQAAGVEVVRVDDAVNISATIRDRLAVGLRLFIAAGGDGTVHHVLQPLVTSEAALAVLPIGTYNHFAKDLQIPLDWRAALEVALHGTTAQIDVARVNDRYFINNLSIGLYPELVARREEHGRNYPRWKARFYAMATTLRRYPHVTLTLESEHRQEVVRTHVFMTSNNAYDLSQIGIEAQRPLLTEGRLTVYWLPHLPRLALMRFAAHYLAGNVASAPGFRSFRTARMKVHSPRRHLHVGLDGEVFTFDTPLVITSVPQSLLVKVPR